MSESSEDKLKLALVTCPPSEAQGIAESLVSERLAACVNIVPQVGSVYRWQGKVESDSESLLVIKTTAKRIDELCERVVELHSYSCPEVIALEVSDGYSPYLNWIVESTSAEEMSD